LEAIMAQQHLSPSVFTFSAQTVRVVLRDDEPWFVAADVCAALDLGNTHRAIDRLDDDEKGVTSINTHGGAQAMSIVSESGLYSLVLGSRKPEAKPFKKWVTSEVLPAIRKSGRYEVGEPLPAVVRSPRLEASMARMADSVATLAAGMQTMSTQLNVTSKYIGLLELNQAGTRKVTAEVAREAKALHAEGMSMADIARILRVSRTAVSLVVRDKYPVAIPEAEAPKTSAGEILEGWIEREQKRLVTHLTREGGAA
jgi:prophage antirepressor-like protein